MGLSWRTLQAFAKSASQDVSALLVDPEAANEKAIHIYNKAGFIKVGEFVRKEGIFVNKLHFVMKMKLT
jgi:RimJ/RimL family protein N-acetyltransferase